MKATLSKEDRMGRKTIRRLVPVFALLGWWYIWLGGSVEHPGVPWEALAAEELKIEGLPKDPKAFRTQLEQIIAKVDSLIGKLKGNAEALPMVLDLMQTRDNVMRELLKMEVTPDGSKWTLPEGRASVEAMLKLLKAQYDKAAGMAT
jgi:hypothetical protein